MNKSKKLLMGLVYIYISIVALSAVEYVTENPPARMRFYSLTLKAPVIKNEKQQAVFNEKWAAVKERVLRDEFIFWEKIANHIKEREKDPNCLLSFDDSVHSYARVELYRVVWLYDKNAKYTGHAVYCRIFNPIANLTATTKWTYDANGKLLSTDNSNNAFDDEPRINDNIFEKDSRDKSQAAWFAQFEE